MKNSSALCRYCYKKEAMVCPECLFDELIKEIERSHGIIEALQDEHIKPNWPKEYRQMEIKYFRHHTKNDGYNGHKVIVIIYHNGLVKWSEILK